MLSREILRGGNWIEHPVPYYGGVIAGVLGAIMLVAGSQNYQEYREIDETLHMLEERWDTRGIMEEQKRELTQLAEWYEGTSMKNYQVEYRKTQMRQQFINALHGGNIYESRSNAMNNVGNRVSQGGALGLIAGTLLSMGVRRKK
jgi:hypothetical protein